MVNVKPVTLYDVAEYAGVSYQTVSRVVNQACHVSAKTREKVEAAMAELITFAKCCRPIPGDPIIAHVSPSLTKPQLLASKAAPEFMETFSSVRVYKVNCPSFPISLGF